jgi:hypothetical protein
VANSLVDSSNLRKKEEAFADIKTRLGIVVGGYLLVTKLSSEGQLRNISNTLLAKDPSENLGLYWYLLSEMFIDRITFFRYMLILMQIAMAFFVSMMVFQVSDVLDLVAEGKGRRQVDAEKNQRRRQRAYMSGFLLIAFVKMIMNPYPTLHDLSILFFLIMMNVTLVVKHVEGFTFLLFGIFYGIVNTWLMLITWLHRFSGNANYLFF